MKRFDGELLKRAELSIAHGSLTNSKRPASFVKGVFPTHLKKGFGSYVVDTFNNEYVDFICGLGSNLLGYNNDEIVQAIITQSRLGLCLSLGTELEVRCAERVKDFFPFVQLVRFLKTGSDATTAACIAARAFTGRQDILSSDYHGWHPEFASLNPPAIGIAEHNYIRKFNSIEEIDSSIAAVIIEPIITDFSKERLGFLRRLRDRCTESGTMLIFDEVITGFRWLNHSVSQEYDIIPDLICLGKALGGGMPLSCLGGRKEVMEGSYFVSSTFAGETLSLAAALKSFDLLQNKYKIDTLWEKGMEFQFKFNDIWREGVRLEGYPTRGIFKSDDQTLALFMQESCRANMLVGTSFFFNFGHIELMDQCLSSFKDILTRIRLGEVKLIGEMPVKPYAQKAREST